MSKEKDKKKDEEVKKPTEKVVDQKPTEDPFPKDMLITIRDFISNYKKTDGASNPYAAAFTTWFKLEGCAQVTEDKEKLSNPLSYTTTYEKWKEIFQTCMNKEVK